MIAEMLACAHPIPRYVLDALRQIRVSGKTNMLDRITVVNIIFCASSEWSLSVLGGRNIFEAASYYLVGNKPSLSVTKPMGDYWTYMEALIESGTGLIH